MVDKLQANFEIVSDKSKNAVTSSEYIKHGNAWLNDAINAATTAVNSKADKSYVDAELAKKATTEALSTVDAKVNGKADANVVSQLQATVNTKADSSTVSALSERVSSTETGVTAANSRIDEIVALPDGSTTADAELVDIRTKADGTKAASAGAAVREQVTDLKSDLSEGFTIKNQPFNDVYGKSISYDYNVICKENGYMKPDGNIAVSQYVDAKHVIINGSAIKKLKVTVKQSVAASLPFIVLKLLNGSAIVILAGNVSAGEHEVPFVDNITGDVCFNWIGANSAYIEGVEITYKTEQEYKKYITKSSTINPDKLEFGTEQTFQFVNVQLNSGYVMNRSDFTVSGQGDGHKHVLLDSQMVKSVKVNPTSQSPVPSYAMWFDREKKNGTEIVPKTGGKYTFESPKHGYIAINDFAGGDFASQYTLEYWNIEEISNGKADGKYIPVYENTVRKPMNFNNKSCVFCGDSITFGSTSGTTSTPNGYPRLFCQAVGATMSNIAVAGSTLSVVDGYASIQTQIQNNSNKNCDYLFIAGGINDWQLGVSLDTVKTAVRTICSYINSNYNNSTKVVFITPINHAGYIGTNPPVADVQEYRNVITRTVAFNDTFARFSVVQGNTFNFPIASDDSAYISQAFGDRLHPTENGYKVIYTPALLNALQ